MATQGRGATNKGKNYERAIAKKLTQLTGVQFNRTAYSGARSTDDLSERTFVGDLFSEDNTIWSRFNFELKNHDNVGINNIVFNNGEVPSFVKQCVIDSARNHTIPCLIIHILRVGDLVLVPYDSNLFSDLIQIKSRYLFSTLLGYEDKRQSINKEYHFMVMDLDTFGSLDAKQLEPYTNKVKITYDSLNINKEPASISDTFVPLDLDNKEVD